MIKIKEFKPSNIQRDEKGLLAMPNGKNFYNDWYALMSAHKIPYIKKSASSNLDDMLRCAVWFMIEGKKDNTSVTDLQHYADLYELSLTQFLAKERILVERGRKRCEIFPNMLSITIKVDCLFNISNDVITGNNIDWVKIEPNAIYINPSNISVIKA